MFIVAYFSANVYSSERQLKLATGMASGTHIILLWSHDVRLNLVKYLTFMSCST